MFISVNRKSFQAALKFLAHALPTKRQGVPRVVELSLSDKTLSLTVTNYTLTLSRSLPLVAPTEMTESLLVDWDILAEVPLTGALFQIDWNCGGIILPNGEVAGTADILARPRVLTAHGSFSFAASAYKKAWQQVAYAVFPTDERPLYQHIQHRVRGGSLYLAAADTYRLAVADPIQVTGKTKDILIPGNQKMGWLPDQGLIKVSFEDTEHADDRICAWTSRTIQYDWEDGQAIFTTVATGNFPDFTKVLPKQYGHSVTVERSVLISVLTSLTKTIEDQSDCAVKLTAQDGTLTLNQAVITGVTIQGTPDPALVNARYLLEACQVSSDPLVKIGLWYVPPLADLLARMGTLPAGVTMTGDGRGSQVTLSYEPDEYDAIELSDFLATIDPAHAIGRYTYSTNISYNKMGRQPISIGSDQHLLMPQYSRH